jgi:Sulfotransferase family
VIEQIPNAVYLKLTKHYIKQLSVRGVPRCLAEAEFFVITQNYLESIFEYMAQGDCQRRVVLKTPHIVLHIDFLRRLFPNVRLLNVIRDPRAIVLSLQRQVWGPDTIVGCAYWLREFYRAYDFQLKIAPYLAEAVTIIRLEDFLTDLDAVTDTLRRSCGLIDFTIDPETVDRQAIEGWKTTITAQAIAQIERILKPYILQWGYELMAE